MKKVDVLAEDVLVLDGVIDEVKTTVLAHDRELKDLKRKLEGHEHRAPFTAIKVWEMYNAGPTGWRCCKNHPGYFEFKVGAKVVFGCTACGVSFERLDHQFEAIKRGHNVYAFPVSNF